MPGLNSCHLTRPSMKGARHSELAVIQARYGSLLGFCYLRYPFVGKAISAINHFHVAFPAFIGIDVFPDDVARWTYLEESPFDATTDERVPALQTLCAGYVIGEQDVTGDALFVRVLPDDLRGQYLAGWRSAVGWQVEFHDSGIGAGFRVPIVEYEHVACARQAVSNPFSVMLVDEFLRSGSAVGGRVSEAIE